MITLKIANNATARYFLQAATYKNSDATCLILKYAPDIPAAHGMKITDNCPESVFLSPEEFFLSHAFLTSQMFQLLRNNHIIEPVDGTTVICADRRVPFRLCANIQPDIDQRDITQLCTVYR